MFMVCSILLRPYQKQSLILKLLKHLYTVRAQEYETMNILKDVENEKINPVTGKIRKEVRFQLSDENVDMEFNNSDFDGFDSKQTKKVVKTV